MKPGQLNTYVIDAVNDFIGFCISAKEVRIVLPEEEKGAVWSINTFLQLNQDSTLVQSESERDALYAYADLKKRALALDLWVLSLECSFNNGNAKIELEKIFEDKFTYDHVRDIFFSSSIKDDLFWLLKKSDAILQDGKIKTLVRSLITSRNRINALCDSFVQLKSRPNYKNIRGRMLKNSFFWEIASKDRTPDELFSLRTDLSFKCKEICPASVVISVLDAYASNLSIEVVKPTDGSRLRVDTMHIRKEFEDDGETWAFEERPQAAKGSSNFTLYSSAQSQIEKITDLFACGKDEVARKFLDELISQQVVDGPGFIVKTLCNIASQTSALNRPEISLELLKNAIEQPVEFVDVVVYLQIAKLFFSLRDYDRSLECYKTAEKLDVTGENSSAIRDNIIRILVNKGDYELALKSYLEIPLSTLEASTKTSLATLYRKMGNLKLARITYSEVFNAFDSMEEFHHRSFAGLAETSRQSGRPHDAISKYQIILKEHGDLLDERSVRVYSFALSQLFRLTEQFDRSLSVLEGLYLKSPLDPDVNFQLSKVHFLMGNRAKSQFHSVRSKLPNLTNLAADLFKFAMLRFDYFNHSQYQVSQSNSLKYSEYHPEERGLVACRNAIQSICNDDPEAAISAVDNAKFVDEFHSDFANVLKFHACRRISPNFRYQDDYRISRIVKRGIHPLRKIAGMVDSNKFYDAIEGEFRFLLLVS